MLFYSFVHAYWKHGIHFQLMKSNYNRKRCAKATTLAQVVARGKGKSTAREEPVNLFPFPNTAQNSQHIIPRASACRYDNGETNNEHNMSLGLISLVPLFSCLSEVWRLSFSRLKPWPNGLASRHKLKTLVYFRLRLARPCVHFRWLAVTCAHFGRDQICTQVKASFLPFGHPTQVNASWVTSINLLKANEIEDSLP